MGHQSDIVDGKNQEKCLNCVVCDDFATDFLHIFSMMPLYLYKI